MFWGKKDKRKDPKNNRVCGSQNNKASVNGGSSSDKDKQSQLIREEALAQASAARAHIGEDTLDKIAASMTKMQQSKMAQAKAQIQNSDPDRMLDEVMTMLRDKS